jgi:tetratricopeptide (TPR) repeat protein
MQQRGETERLAGDPVAAERYLRAGYELLEETGETGVASTNAALLADALLEQGRYDEADWFAARCRELSSSDDAASQSLWRAVRAKLLARQGRLQEAEALARQAVEIMEATDSLSHQADVRVALAFVLQAAGRGGEAAEALEAAIDRYDRKGNVVAAERTRALLAAGDGER